ncbi:MAG: hypothetical protein LUD02_03415 [Tannerellaceae bacterium]|nr:hypothetical protein [Tannerellaceae bacterium]
MGKVVLTPRGEYDPQHAYQRLDVISYQGSSWLVLTPFAGITPSRENESVMLLAAKGDTGKALSFEELTPEQQQALRGEKGEEGKGFVILGHYNTLSELEM